MWSWGSLLLREKVLVLSSDYRLSHWGWGLWWDCISASSIHFVGFFFFFSPVCLVLGFVVVVVFSRRHCSIFRCRFAVSMGGDEFRDFLHYRQDHKQDEPHSPQDRLTRVLRAGVLVVGSQKSVNLGCCFWAEDGLGLPEWVSLHQEQPPTGPGWHLLLRPQPVSPAVGGHRHLPHGELGCE